MLRKAKRKARPRVLYHWSPRNRRGRILRQGLRLNQPCFGNSEPHPRAGLAFCDDPARAWRLSAACFGKRGQVFDLWLVYVHKDWPAKWQPHYEGSIPEFRVYCDVPRTRVYWIGERTAGWNPQK